jgi:hypothetical protein
VRDELWDENGRFYLVGTGRETQKKLAKLGVKFDGAGAYVQRGDNAFLDGLRSYLPNIVHMPTLGVMVPASSWGSNLHRLLTDACWQHLRQQTFAACDYRCQVCGSAAPLECHEVWVYNEPMGSRDHGVQALEQLVGLCSLCHETQHLGFANRVGRLGQALSRLAFINDWTNEQVLEHYNDAVDDCTRRSKVGWMLDLGRLEDDISVRKNWRVVDNLHLATQGRTGPAFTKLLGIGWRLEGRKEAYLTKLKIKLLRNIPYPDASSSPSDLGSNSRNQRT